MIDAMVGAEHQRFAGEIASAGENVEIRAIHLGVCQHVGNGSALGLRHSVAHFVEFIPVAKEVMIVSLRGDVPTIASVHHVGGSPLPMARDKVVALRTCIAEVGIAGKIIFGESEIGFVGMLVGIARFEFQTVIDAGVEGRFHQELARNVVTSEAFALVGVAFAETFRTVVQIFEHKARVLPAVAHHGVGFERVEATVRRIESGSEAIWHCCGNQVHRAARGEGTILHLAAAFEHLHGLHACHVGEVVGGRCGVGRGRNEHPVFHEGDAFAALGFCAAQTDVGTQTESVFFVDIDARHAFEQAIDVGVAHALYFLRRDVVGRPRAVAGFKLTAEHLSGADDHFRDFDVSARGVFTGGIGGREDSFRGSVLQMSCSCTQRHEPREKESEKVGISHRKGVRTAHFIAYLQREVFEMRN